MNQNPENASTTPDPAPFAGLSRWLDMFDEVMGINQKPQTEDK